MTRVRVGLEIKALNLLKNKKLAKAIENAALTPIVKTAQGSISAGAGPGGLISIAENAINKTVEEHRDSFIPTDEQAIELGIGNGGKIDRNRTERAYKALRVPHIDSVTTITVEKAQSLRTGAVGSVGSVIKILTLNINIDELKFFNNKLSNVPTPDSEAIASIPWMRWLIEGAPTITGFRFKTLRTPTSFTRTGGGYMAKGGLWDFIPTNPNAFEHLRLDILDELFRQLGQQAASYLPLPEDF